MVYSYLQALLGLEDLCKRLASLDTQCVAQKPHLLDIVVLLQGLDMGLDILGGGELQALAFEREELRHVDQYQRNAQLIK